MRPRDRAKKGKEAGTCPKCGKPKQAGERECPFCGVIYHKAGRPEVPPDTVPRTAGAPASSGEKGRIALVIETARRSRRAIAAALLFFTVLFLILAYYRHSRNQFVYYFNLVQEVSGEMIRSAIMTKSVCLAHRERMFAERREPDASAPEPEGSEEKGFMRGIIADYEHISALMKELEDAPRKFHPVARHTLKLYELYSQLYGAARRPKGTPEAYEHKVRELEKGCMIQYQRIEILLGRLLRG